jgi:hypothetical protein
MKKPFFVIIYICAGFLLVGCQTTEPVVKKTSLEIQAIQAKMFEADRVTAFRSVVSVLQDLGYIVQAASLETGLVTAQSPTKQDNSGGAVLAAAFAGIRTEGRTVVTATVEDFNSKQTRVRLNFVEKRFRSGAYGQQASDEKAIEDPTIYENAFEKIGEAIFIRQAQK